MQIDRSQFLPLKNSKLNSGGRWRYIHTINSGVWLKYAENGSRIEKAHKAQDTGESGKLLQ